MNRKSGAIYTGNNRCEFVVWAPLLKSVEIELNDGKRRIPLEKDEWGYWSAEAGDVPPGSLYWCVLNHEKKLPDLCSMSQPEGIHGRSEVVDHNAFTWTDHSWCGTTMEDMIIYELHVGTFTPEGTFEGVISKLDHLKELGITAIELMPVAQFPGERNWGYDGALHYAVQHSYGGVSGLKKLVDACHRVGLAVILDVVYNHIGDEGNHFKEFGPFFTEKYITPWGPAINFDGPYSDDVRNFFLQNIRMWIEDYHIDAFRLDAVHAYSDTGSIHFLQAMNSMVKSINRKTGCNHVLIGECDLNDPKYITPVEANGLGLDGQWIDEFHHSLHALLTGESNGYYEDFGTLEHFYRAFRDTYVYAERYSFHRKKTFGRYPVQHPYSQFVVFCQNHDQIGNRLNGERLSKLVYFEALKLAAAAVLTSPYVPLLYMGEEFCEENPFYFFSDYSDKALIEKMKVNRKEEFKHFTGESNFIDAQDMQTFLKSKLNWDLSDKKKSIMLNYYKELIRFRKINPACQERERSSIKVMTDDSRKLLILERAAATPTDHLCILMNFDDKESEYIWTKNQAGRLCFNSASEIWMGPGSQAPQELKSRNIVRIPSKSVIIYRFDLI